MSSRDPLIALHLDLPDASAPLDMHPWGLPHINTPSYHATRLDYLTDEGVRVMCPGALRAGRAPAAGRWWAPCRTTTLRQGGTRDKSSMACLTELPVCGAQWS